MDLRQNFTTSETPTSSILGPTIEEEEEEEDEPTLLSFKSALELSWW